MAIVAGSAVLWMLPAIHENDAVGMGPTDVKNKDALKFGKLDELDAVGRQELPGSARGLATRVRFELVRPPILVHRLRPRLERDFTHFRFWELRTAASAASEPSASARSGVVRIHHAFGAAASGQPDAYLSGSWTH